MRHQHLFFERFDGLGVDFQDIALGIYYLTTESQTWRMSQLARRRGEEEIEHLPILADANEVRLQGIEQATSGYYLRIPSLDKPGVFAKVATLLSERDISIEAAIQKEQAVHDESEAAWVPIIILTQPVRESVMIEALAAVQELPEVVGEIHRIRVEHLSGD